MDQVLYDPTREIKFRIHRNKHKPFRSNPGLHASNLALFLRDKLSFLLDNLCIASFLVDHSVENNLYSALRFSLVDVSLAELPKLFVARRLHNSLCVSLAALYTFYTPRGDTSNRIYAQMHVASQGLYTTESFSFILRPKFRTNYTVSCIAWVLPFFSLSASAHLEQIKLVSQPSASSWLHSHSSYPGPRRWPQSQTNHSPFQTSVLSRLIGAPTKTNLVLALLNLPSARLTVPR
jgi:hypothetical protein